eukprot:10331585-Alexandrium_andersonii.AAC.1
MAAATARKLATPIRARSVTSAAYRSALQRCAKRKAWAGSPWPREAVPAASSAAAFRLRCG